MTLQQYDLKDLVDNILEIDSFKSKMGADKDIVTVAFATKTKESADDLAEFIERGYTNVLEADLYGVDSDTLKDLSESMNNYTNFFNKSMVENVTMWNNMITVKKAWADPVAFTFVDFGTTQKTLDNINESFNPNDFSEIIFLTKYLGDYNITKYGNKLTFENQGYTLVLERIIL